MVPARTAAHDSKHGGGPNALCFTSVLWKRIKSWVSTKNSDRQRRYRQRQAAGRTVLSVACDLALLEDALVAEGRLSPTQLDNPDRVRWAGAELASELLAKHLDRVTRNADAGDHVRESPSLPSAATKSADRAAVSPFLQPGRRDEVRDHANSKPRVAKLPIVT